MNSDTKSTTTARKPYETGAAAAGRTRRQATMSENELTAAEMEAVMRVRAEAERAREEEARERRGRETKWDALPDLLTTAQAAEVGNTNVRMIQRLAKAGKVKAVRMGESKWRVNKASLLAYCGLGE